MSQIPLIPMTPGTPIINEAFRFVHIHEPEPVDDDNPRPRFVSPPVPKGKSKKTTKSSFEPLASLDEVKAIAPDLYSFAIQLRKGKLSDEELAKAVSQTEPLKEDARVLLWENLYYQLLGDQSRAVTRAVTKLIQADHFVTSYKKSEAEGEAQNRAYWNSIINATLLIPKDIFPEVEQPEKGKTNYADNLSHSIVLRRLNFDVAKYRMKQLRKTVEEIKDAEKSYGQLYRLRYDKAQADYQEEVERLRAEAEAARPPVEEGEEPKPLEIDYPPFEFTPPNTFAQNQLSKWVSPETYERITALKKDSDEQLRDVRKTMEKAVGAESLRLVRNTLKPQQFTMFNNIRVPLRTRPLSDMIAYKVMPLPHKPGYYSLYITQHFSHHAAKAMEVIVTLNPEKAKKGTPSTSCKPIAMGGEYITFELFPEGIEMPKSCEPTTLNIQYTRDDGTTIVFPDVSTTGPGDIFTDNGGGTIITDNGGNNDVPVAGPIAYGNGITNLGVGDFMRVEQELCCYVEGEVSHVENLMQGEFKERSTRNLTRSEITTEETSEREVENLTDTTTTERYEMQTEISETLQGDQSQNFGASASVSGNFGSFGFSAATNFSTTSSSSESFGFNQAESYAQEVTERAMKRVVEKVSRKRTSRILREFEETNKHGFDNREGTGHVTGIYRWVDKVYENRLYNYGKRMMLEFMVPEPAKNFKDKLSGNESGTALNSGLSPIPPLPPVSPEKMLEDDGGVISNFITRENYGELAALYGAEIEPMPDEVKTIGQSYSENLYVTGSRPTLHAMGDNALDEEEADGAYNYDLGIPEGYECGYFDYGIQYHLHGSGWDNNIGGTHIRMTIGTWTYFLPYGIYGNDNGVIHTDGDYQYVLNEPVESALPISIRTRDIGTYNLNVIAYCQLKEDVKENWCQQAFMALKAAYRERVQEYNDYVAQQQAQQASQNEGDNNYLINPLIARSIEKRELKRLAMWFITKLHTNILDIGQPLYSSGDIPDISNQNFNYVDYAKQVKFMEEAFDWEIMAYTLYPYYWAKKDEWENLLKTTSNSDFIFQSFLQAGMGKMVVPVKAGYEKRAMVFLRSGAILPPTLIDFVTWDEEHQAMITALDMMNEFTDEQDPNDPNGTIAIPKVRARWKTRIPTSLTMIQTGSNPLNMSGLGCADGSLGGSLGAADENNMSNTLNGVEDDTP